MCFKYIDICEKVGNKEIDVKYVEIIKMMVDVFIKVLDCLFVLRD